MKQSYNHSKMVKYNFTPPPFSQNNIKQGIKGYTYR